MEHQMRLQCKLSRSKNGKKYINLNHRYYYHIIIHTEIKIHRKISYTYTLHMTSVNVHTYTYITYVEMYVQLATAHVVTAAVGLLFDDAVVVS